MDINTFKNGKGVLEIGIGTRIFGCIGASPPMDHPKVYLNMGKEPSILCPYCATKYTYFSHLGPQETDLGWKYHTNFRNFVKTMDE